MTESRKHFRAPVLDEQVAVVCVGPKRLPVRIVDQSSGGLSLLAECAPEFPRESLAEVQFDDGLCLAGRIKHIDPCDEGFRLGFQRIEMITDAAVDFRELFPVSQTKSVSRPAIALVLVLGLTLGWMVQTGAAQKFYQRTSAALRTR